MRRPVLVLVFFVIGYMGTALFSTGLMERAYPTEQIKCEQNK